MKWGAPHWLWVLLVLPILYFILVLDEKKKDSKLEKFISLRLLKILSPERDPRAKLRKALVWTLAVGSFILAMARPQWGSHEEKLTFTGIERLYRIRWYRI